MYRPEIDVTSLKAIDVHVHVELDSEGHQSLPTSLADAAAGYFRSDNLCLDVSGIAEYYRSRDMAAVVFSVDARTQLDHEPIASEAIIEQAADNADVLIPFASVDPRRGAAALDELERLVVDHGARGVKLHPTLQGFDPSSPEYRPLWETIARLKIPALVHTGQTGIGAGLARGAGLHLRYSNPMLLDDVAAEVADLKLILAHPSVPWQDEAISIATHKPGVRIDLSGWRPKYFPSQLLRASSSFLRDKVLFGSDFPLITPERWLADFDELSIPETARNGILRDNAARFLDLIQE